MSIYYCISRQMYDRMIMGNRYYFLYLQTYDRHTISEPIEIQNIVFGVSVSRQTKNFIIIPND